MPLLSILDVLDTCYVHRRTIHYSGMATVMNSVTDLFNTWYMVDQLLATYVTRVIVSGASASIPCHFYKKERPNLQVSLCYVLAVCEDTSLPHHSKEAVDRL